MSGKRWMPLVIIMTAAVMVSYDTLPCSGQAGRES